MRFAITRTALGVATALLLALCGRRAAAQQATVDGRVVDSASHQPLISAEVVVAGTTIRALTDREGRFHIANAPAGSITLRAKFIGYKVGVRTVTASAGQPTEVELLLVPAPVGLEAVVVTATGQEMLREQGNAVHTVDPADIISKGAPTSLADALSARTPGLLIQNSGGTTGTGTRVRIRGSNSLSLSNEPVIYVDGIRVENGASSISVGVGGQTPSRLNDIDPSDLERVQIAGGPSANVLYGTDAANGVIQLQTKQGKAGPTRWDMYAEGGILNDIATYPANYRGLDVLDSLCTLITTVRATNPCVQTRLATFNPLETNSPFRTGHRRQYGLAASGGTEQTTYYLAGHFNDEQGIYAVNQNRQTSFLLNVHQLVGTKFDVLARAGYTAAKLRLPEYDNNSLGVLSSGFLGRADSLNQGYGFLTPRQSFSIRTFQNIDRFTGSIISNYRPQDWLTVNGVVGVDFTSRFDERTFIPGAIPAAFSATSNAGSRAANPFQIYNWTGTINATASFVVTPSITSTTTAGFQYYRNVFHGVLASRQNQTVGTGSLGGGVIPADSETTQPVATLGKYLDQRVGIKNRLFLDGALRSDQNSAFGVKFANILYPKFSASWVISEEPFFPQSDNVSTLRLRAAWGRSGVHPGPLDGVEYFSPTPVVVNNVDVPGFTAGNLGNRNLRPERTREVELGFEAGLFRDVAHLDVAYYDKSSSDALVAVTLAPSLGGPTTQFENLGRVTNKGIEILARVAPVRRPNLEINVSVNAWGNRNRLVELGPGISPIIFGLGGASQRHQPGYALGSYFMTPYTFRDANRDGIVDTSEVTLGSAPVFIGQPFPDHGVGLAVDVTIQRHVRLYGLLDGRFGNKLFNSTEQFRCLPPRNNCRGLNDRTASLEDQAAAAANLKGTQAGYIQDGAFTKLREVSVTYFAPTRWAKFLGASDLSFAVVGRNLATWTKYQGVDPELNEAGQNNFTTADFLTQPPVRYFIGRVNITF